jgi:hypothetical protein
MLHETRLENAGSYYAWCCTCGRTSRHLAPLQAADRNAKAHERKYNKQSDAVGSVSESKGGGG